MKFDVVVATPSSGQCKTQFAFSLAHLIMYYNRVPVRPNLKEQAIRFVMAEGTGVSGNRDDLVDQFLETDATHLLFIDDDMGFNSNVLHILASKHLPIVGCNYRLRTPPARFMAIKGKYAISTTKDSFGVEPVDYMGFGFCLMERQVLESVERPRFLGEYVNGTYTTEDYAFFKKTPFQAHIDHDASKLIWHVGNVNYYWGEDYTNVNKIFVKPEV